MTPAERIMSLPNNCPEEMIEAVLTASYGTDRTSGTEGSEKRRETEVQQD